MTQLQYKHQQFEKEKNLKAAGLTLACIAGLFAMFFLVSWSVPIPPVVTPDEGIEVNLGNSEQGLGDVAPMRPGDLSEAEETNTAAAPSTSAATEETPVVDENDDANATVVHTTSKPVSKNKPLRNENTTVKKNTKSPTVNTPPRPAQPKAVYSGGKNKSDGGNNADSYNNVSNQGIAGGKGDQGKPNGNPNSDNYTGNGGTGNGGINISSGLSGRRISSNTRFEDTYRYGGKVLVQVSVDENGKVTNATLYQGSAFSDINRIAIKRAYEIKFSKGDSEQTGVITIRFENPKG